MKKKKTMYELWQRQRPELDAVEGPQSTLLMSQRSTVATRTLLIRLAALLHLVIPPWFRPRRCKRASTFTKTLKFKSDKSTAWKDASCCSLSVIHPLTCRLSNDFHKIKHISWTTQKQLFAPPLLFALLRGRKRLTAKNVGGAPLLFQHDALWCKASWVWNSFTWKNTISPKLS